VKKNLEIQKQILTSEEYTTGWWSGASLGEWNVFSNVVFYQCIAFVDSK
jgi:hypothetical protein